jgi:putative FmdB family regulatory protein
MPIYQYTCDDCEKSFDQLVPSTRVAADVHCPECDSPHVSRSLSIPAKVTVSSPATNCRGDGPPCGATGCGRMRPA